MDRANRHRAVTDRPGHALDGAVARVAHRKHAGQAGFERQWLTVDNGPPTTPGRIDPSTSAALTRPVLAALPVVWRTNQGPATMVIMLPTRKWR